MPEYKVAIVFGAGVNPDGKPQDMLKDRLEATASLYNNGKIDKILVSGDNRYKNYNEPQAMYNYLVNDKQIPAEDVVRDFAGRRTYDTCARANQIWGIKKALLISQGYHLSRALLLCNSLGVKSNGYSATLNDYENDTFYKIREILAIHKSVIDLYIYPPDYVKGKKETDFE